MVFCRSCGQEFHPVWAHLHNRSAGAARATGVLDESSLKEQEVVNGYFMPDAEQSYSIDDLEKANFPDGWLEPDKDGELVLRRTYRHFAPVPCRFRSRWRRQP